MCIPPAKWPPTRAPLQLRVLGETLRVERGGIGAVDGRVEVHLPKGREHLPAGLQDLAADGDLLGRHADGDGVDGQAEDFVVEGGEQRAVV